MILKKNSQTEVPYRLAWARTYLKKFGLLENSSRGIWSLTEKANSIEEVDPAEVVRFDRALDRIDAPRGKTEDATALEISAAEGWKDRLSAVLTKKLDPAAFEQLLQWILRESGSIQVEVTGRTGDGYALSCLDCRIQPWTACISNKYTKNNINIKQ